MVSARLGALIALTLAGITITVAYDRARDNDADAATTSTTTNVTLPPETTPSIGDPSSTVDITSLTPATDPVTSTVASTTTVPGTTVAQVGDAAKLGFMASGATRAVALDDRTW
jgi:hypothetical protein